MNETEDTKCPDTTIKFLVRNLFHGLRFLKALLAGLLYLIACIVISVFANLIFYYFVSLFCWSVGIDFPKKGFLFHILCYQGFLIAFAWPIYSVHSLLLEALGRGEKPLLFLLPLFATSITLIVYMDVKLPYDGHASVVWILLWLISFVGCSISIIVVKSFIWLFAGAKKLSKWSDS